MSIEIDRKVADIVNLLDVRERHIIWLYYHRKWKQAAIAEVFRLSQPAVNKILRNARRKLLPHKMVIIQISPQDIDGELLALLGAMN